jgi:hypothetical protein
MAKATDQSKAGSVTVAIVRGREEAMPIARKLEGAGISCILTVERDPDKPIIGNRSNKFSEIKIQVSRADAARAVQLLRAKENDGAVRPRDEEFVARRSRTWLPLKGWQQAVLGTVVMVGFAALLAAWLF